MLMDRRTERSALDSLLASGRGGLGCALVLRGEPGVGKTALLEYAIDSAAGFRIVRAGGTVEIGCTRTALRSISAGPGRAEPGSAAAALP